MNRSVLITDGEQRAALAVVRSLGRAGYRCHVCAAIRGSLAGSSRYAVSSTRVPDALCEPEAFRQALAQLVRHHEVDILLPVTEPALLAVLGDRAPFPDVVIPFPGLEVFRAISDKQALMQAAPEVGIAVPAQRVLHSAASLDALTPETLPYPLVLKPARSVGEVDGERMKLGVRYAANAAELRLRVRRLPAPAFPVLLQQRILGPGIGIFLLLCSGEMKAVFSHRRLREKPPSGGVSVYRESIAADPNLVERSRALLARFGWEGVAMVEYKVEAATGTPYLMEVNGRFWGSLQLAIDAGVDFPRLLVEHALGAAPAPATRYRAGVRSRWWWGDVDHLLARLRRGGDALSLPPDAPRRSAVVWEFLKLWRPGDRNETLRIEDPLPFFRETLDWIRGR